MPVETSRVYMRRLALQHRHLAIARAQNDLHIKKKKREARKVTPEERKNRMERKKDSDKLQNDKITTAQDTIWNVCVGLSEDLGKTPQYWQRFLMQLLRIATSERKTSRWNAYLSLSLEEVNAEIPEGLPKKSVNDAETMDKIKTAWRAMSEEQQIECTKERLSQIEEDRKTKSTGKHTVAINAFHDFSSTIVKLEDTCRELCMRTGCEVLAFVVRGDIEHYNRPTVIESSPRVKNFFKMCFNQLPIQWVLNLEAFCLSGFEAVKNKYAENLKIEQAECAAKIIEQLQLAAAPGHVGRMNYENFGDITKRHRVVYQNWPVTFCSPSKLGILELHTLHSILHSTNPPPLFRKLTNTEWGLFKEAVANGTPYVLPPPTTVSTMPTALRLPGPSNRDSVNETVNEAVNDSETINKIDTVASGLISSTPGPNAGDAEQGTATPGPTTQDVQIPNPRGGAIISFNEGSGGVLLLKTRRERYDARLSAAEKEAARKVRAAEKEAEKKAKAAERAAKQRAQAAEKAAKQQARAVAAAAKKAARNGFWAGNRENIRQGAGEMEVDM